MMLQTARRLLDDRLANALITRVCPTDDALSREGIECNMIELVLTSEMDDMVMPTVSPIGDLSHAIGMLASLTSSCLRRVTFDPCSCARNWKRLSCYNSKTMSQFEEPNDCCNGEISDVL